MSIDPQHYVANLGIRLEKINDLRATIGQPLLTRGELIRRDLQEGLTPLEIRLHLENELGKEHVPAPKAPTIEEESETPEPSVLDALNIALAHLEGRRNTFSTRNPIVVARILRGVLGEHVDETRGT